MRRATSPRGFTLIELMVTTAIIGILASVAIPNLLLVNTRAKAAERAGVVRAMKTSLNALRIKDGSFGSGITGAWNPALPTSMSKRPVLVGAAGWNKLDLSLEGRLYYSYMFTAGEDPSPYFAITVQGDVDGNGQAYVAAHQYDLVEGTFLETSPASDPLYERTVF